MTRSLAWIVNWSIRFRDFAECFLEPHYRIESNIDKILVTPVNAIIFKPNIVTWASFLWMRVLCIRIAPYCVIFPHDEIHPDVGNK